MSILIKGMEMPKSCFECDLYNDESNFCKAQKEYMPFASFGRDYKDANCPLVELPEKHERLISADFVIEKASHEAKAMDEPFKSNFDVLVEWIVDKTPTVIEAEGSE